MLARLIYKVGENFFGRDLEVINAFCHVDYSSVSLEWAASTAFVSFIC